MKKTITILSFLSILTFVGCNNVPEPSPVATAPVVPAKSLATHTLESIVQEQVALFASIEANPDAYSQNEKERLIDNILKQYEDFLTENPKNVEAFIFYGKLLRQVGHTEEASKAFLAANKIDPDIPVVKQQLGNYLAEKGDYALALPYFMNAIDLSPETPVYHYQLGELLNTYNESFIHDKILTPEQVDAQMLSAFLKAKELEPAQWIYQMRYAEAFYDLNTRQWSRALELWNSLESIAPTSRDTEIIYLHQARVLIKLKNHPQAQDRLAKVFLPELEQSRRELLDQIPSLANDAIIN